jgi:SAM-dependent methyltransferase
MANWWRRPLGEYDGRLMRCAPGAHEAAGEIVVRHASRDAKVLDLASGTGAFLARLRDAGFANLHAVELNVQGFRFENVTPQPVDLNSKFADALPHGFQLITAIEIIEHLDCPRAFLRNVRALLADGGHLLLTTPNVSHWLGRLRFLMSGELRQFQRHDYDYQRHISPITDVQMRLMFEEMGFDVVEATTAGTFFGSVKSTILAPVSLMARMMWGSRAEGDVAIYLVKKADRSTQSAGRDSMYFKTTGA